jgi:hypothetical protein
MRSALKKITCVVLLLGTFLLQAHVLLHDEDHCADHAKGKAHEACQLCVTALAQITLSPVDILPLAPVSRPFALPLPLASRATSHASILRPSLRGPPAPTAA